VLDDLKAIARGDKVRLDTEAMDAAKALQMREGEHPETLAAWAPVMDDLTAENVKDANAIKRRLNELLYPDNLEDLEALKKRQADGLKKLARGEGPDSEAVEAAKALREHYEIGRLQCEQELAEAKKEREKEERRRKEHIRFMEEDVERSRENLKRLKRLKRDDKGSSE
jgi:hypothetical protein